MSLFSAYRFLLLTRCAHPALVTTIKARGGVMIPAALAANAAAASSLASDAQVIAMADEDRLQSLDPAVRSIWKGRVVRSVWVSDSVRRGKLQDLAAYRIGATGASVSAAAAGSAPSAAANPVAVSSSLAVVLSPRSGAAVAAAASASASERPSVTGSSSIAALLSTGTGKRSRAASVDPAVPLQSQVSATATSAAPPSSSSPSASKKARLDPLLASVLRQHRRTSLEHKLQKFNRAPDAPITVDAASSREEIVIDSTPESIADEAAAIASMSREDQISAAVSSLVASGFSLPLIVHALLVASGRFGVARHYLLHGSLPGSEQGWGPEDDGAIGSGQDDAIRDAIARRGKDSVQRRVEFLHSVSAEAARDDE